MSDRDETVIAEAMLNMPSPIAAEEFEPGFWRSCATWEQIVEKATPAILAALKANRIALVELPEPTSRTENTALWPTGTGWAVMRNVGRVIAESGDSHGPDDAREFAAALLAAAAEVSR
ncbi:hypothetical protein [Mycolicibacterium goodii]|uniref:hypothetical protein n=1 Tax=Mycolicibacterium goodii TaxID=134601 RepID=UPI001BDDB833|nr:hypothetical protein [Mycolicibacterium goodii]MBU8819574.1 hypothetical protein [Mycolicibacterium goodii]MBU8833627.1 hypothetical protein [Mycolicibacterium goodii]